MIEETVDLTTRKHPCPRCGGAGRRHSLRQRVVFHIRPGATVRLTLRYRAFACRSCGRAYSTDLRDIAPEGSRYSHAVRAAALGLVASGKTLQEASMELMRSHGLDLPHTTIHDWTKETAHGDAHVA